MAAINYEKILYKGNENNLPIIDPEDTKTKLRFTLDTRKIFLDDEGERIEFSDFIKGMTDAQIKAILAPLPKFYLASDSAKLYFYDNGEWLTVTSDKATKDGNGNIIVNTYALKDSPAFTGTPTTPDVSAGDSTTKIANTKFVNTAIANAISGITSFDYDMVNTLPATGVKGTIYFVPISSPESQDNVYEEYLWIPTSNKFEKIGTFETDIDLTEFVNEIEVTGNGNAVTAVTKSGQKITFTKGATFLTEHPNIDVTNSNTSSSPSFGGTIDVITKVTQDSNGHATNVVKTTLTLPSSTATTSSKGLMPALDGSANKYLKGDGTWGTPSNTTYANATTASAGLLPTLDGSTSKYLRADGTWGTPNNTTYAEATTSAAGLLKKLDGSTTKYLRSDGTWVAPPNTTYAEATTSSAGLLKKLENDNTKFLRSDGTWAVPASASTVTTTSPGLVPSLDGSASKFFRADGTWGTPSNTTYAEATTSSAGLLKKLENDNTKFLRSDGTWAAVDNVSYSHNSGNAYRPFLFANVTTASTATSTGTLLRNNSGAFNPNTGTAKFNYIDATPANGVDFDFGYLNSTVAGDETYGS